MQYADMVLTGLFHVGLGQGKSADIRVRFPSGEMREVKNAKAGTVAEVRE